MHGITNILDSSLPTEDTDNNYYRLLNCDESASIDQINAEFKILAMQCHPDKNSGSRDSLRRFQILQEARNTLTEPEKRREYDKWRRSEMSMTFKQWLALGTRCQPTMHWAKPSTQTMLEYEDDSVSQPGSSSSKTALPAATNAPLDVDDLRRLQNKNVPWKSESRCGVYKEFRNYQI